MIDETGKEKKRVYARSRYRESASYREAAKARARAAYWDGRERFRYLRTKYGITKETYFAMLAEQDGKCAICLRTDAGDKRKTNFCVDHDHATGQVRGLLCTQCNRSLGLFKEDPELLKRAITYLTGMQF